MNQTWGPIYWNFLHTMSFLYPDKPTNEIKKVHKDFLQNLPNLLPCNICKQHLLSIYKEYPITNQIFKNKDTFSFYIYQLHNRVNVELNKKNYIPYSQIKSQYTETTCKCHQL